MRLDHLAVAGETLEAATAHVQDALGVELQPGGKHVKFGTHNTLLGLADGLYLEAIAADPAAPSPELPRWFDLDRFTGAPRLSNWICRVNDLQTSIESSVVALGEIHELERGALRWRMAVPGSGRLPFNNLFPALIQWQGDLHPAQMLQSSGCSLQRLVVYHPDALDLARVLGPLDRVVFDSGPAALRAEFATPHGPRVLQ
ncbi:MAG: VOC family protein [Ruegeria sp.]